MKIKIWGARGSIPSPLLPDAVRNKIYDAIMGLDETIDTNDPAAVRNYVNALQPLAGGTVGGNTPCIEVQSNEQTIIIDAGSGIRELGLKLMEGACGRGEGVLHLLFTHPHWDHIQGFPFFRPAFVPGNQIYIYYAHDIDWRNEVLGEQQRFINFPVPIDVMQANLDFIKLRPDDVLQIGSAKISHIKLNHPGDAYAYRFEEKNSVFVHASDAEYKAFDEPSLRPYIEFFRDADVLFFDTQLTLREVTFEKEDWGHSSALIGADLARRAGVKKLVLFHHDPTHSDEELLQIQAETIEYQAQDTVYTPCEIVVGREGLVFDLTPAQMISVTEYADSDAATLTLPAVFDERRVKDFQQELDRLTATGWPARLIIDLSFVESLAIVGLKPLITLRQQHPDTLIALVGLSKRVQRVINLAGFTDFFVIYPSVEDVLATPEFRKTPGELITNRYRIGEKLGESAVGVVFEANDTHLETTVAVKILSISFSQQAIDQFLNRARQITQLDHPNIVNVLDCAKVQGFAYIVQEFLEGKTLDEFLVQPGEPLPLSQAINIGINVARAMEYAHSRGVYHGDLRPRNIFLTNDGSWTTSTPGNSLGMLKLTDFGLGRLREGQNLLDNVLVLHTAHYLAPEQIIGEPLEAHTDLYALGVILYEILTGQTPFNGSDHAIMEAHLNETPTSPRELNPQISRSLEHVILKLLAKDPEERYSTAHQVERVLSNLGIPESAQMTGLLRHQQYPLVGREETLQALLESWQQAQAGQGQLLLISGETGIGKTRLTQEMAMLAQPEMLLMGQCHPMEGSLAYQPFIEALRTYFATVPPNIADEQMGQLLGNVVRWVPEIRMVMPNVPEAPPLEPRQEQLRLMNSLAQYIERATQEHPWLLILDDLHWADQSSLQLLHYLARHCTSISLLIIGTYRDTDLEHDHPLLETLQTLQRSSPYKTFNLDRLQEDEVGTMLTNIWGKNVPMSLRQKIYEVTEGNPFYVEEVANGLVDEGTVYRQDGVWSFSTNGAVHLPQSVRDAVLQRISLLSRDTQSLLRQAAVLGRQFQFDDLRQMSELSEWVLLEQLDVPLERQLIEEAPGETTLRFTHAEIQQVLYEELSSLRRRLLHRQAGEALEVRYLADPRRMAEELAHHFYEASELEKALIYSIQAARHADQAYASSTALMWYGRALDVLNQLDLKESTQIQMFDLHLARERLLGRQGLREAQANDLKAAQEIAQQLDDPIKLAKVHNQQSYYYRLINNFSLAAEHAQLALQGARQAKDPILEGESLSNLAYIEQDQEEYQTALQHMQAAQTILANTDDRRMEAIALTGLGTLFVHLNDFSQGQKYLRQALEMNRSIGNRRGESTCLNNLGEVQRKQGNYSAALDDYEQTLAIDRAIGDRLGEAKALHNLGQVFVTLGQYDLAQQRIEQANLIYLSIDDMRGQAELETVQSAIDHALENFEAAKASAAQAIAKFASFESHFDLAEAYLQLGLALEALKDFAAAGKAFEQAKENWLVVNQIANTLDAEAGLARCALNSGDVDGAVAQIEQSLQWLDEHSLTGLDHPFRFYQTAHQILQKAGKSKAANRILAEAHSLLETRAARIDNVALRQSFLTNVPENQAIITAWRATI